MPRTSPTSAMRPEFAERRLQHRPEALGAGDDVHLRVDLLHLERHGRGHGMAGVGVAVGEVAVLVGLGQHRLVHALD